MLDIKEPIRSVSIFSSNIYSSLVQGELEAVIIPVAYNSDQARVKMRDSVSCCCYKEERGLSEPCEHR